MPDFDDIDEAEAVFGDESDDEDDEAMYEDDIGDDDEDVEDFWDE